MKNLMTAAFIAVLSLGGAAHAATLSGTFTVGAVNAEDLSGSESQATLEDAQNALDGTTGANALFEVFTYEGALDFGTFDGSDGTTVGDWLATGGGTVTGLSAALAERQLSSPSIGAGTATTTFFLFTIDIASDIDRLDIMHDDGVNVFDEIASIGSFINPTGVRTTSVFGFDGGTLSILYVATNGDPSVLKVAAVPLPASALLMLGGLGGLAALRRRK